MAPADSMSTSTTSSTISMTTVVNACSTRPNRLFSVIRTAASIAPGLAIDGTPSGNIAADKRFKVRFRHHRYVAI
jgi:hypothetical protein